MSGGFSPRISLRGPGVDPILQTSLKNYKNWTGVLMYNLRFYRVDTSDICTQAFVSGRNHISSRGICQRITYTVFVSNVCPSFN